MAARTHWKCPGVSPTVCDHWPPSLRLLPRSISGRDGCAGNSVSWLGAMQHVQGLVIAGRVGAEHGGEHIQQARITYRTFVYLHKAYIIMQWRSVYSDAADWLAEKIVLFFLMHEGNWCSDALWYLSINRTELCSIVEKYVLFNLLHNVVAQF